MLLGGAVALWMAVELSGRAATQRRALTTWSELERDPDVISVEAGDRACSFQTVWGAGSIEFTGDHWLLEVPCDPRFPIVELRRNLVEDGWRAWSWFEDADALVPEHVHVFRRGRGTTEIDLGPVVRLNVAVLQPRDVMDLMALSRAQIDPWARAHERFSMRARPPGLTRDGALDGVDFSVYAPAEHVRARLVFGARLATRTMRIAHVDRADAQRVQLGNALIDMTLAVSGDHDRAREILDEHVEDILALLHANPGSELTERGFEVVLASLPTDDQLVSWVERGARVCGFRKLWPLNSGNSGRFSSHRIRG